MLWTKALVLEREVGEGPAFPELIVWDIFSKQVRRSMGSRPLTSQVWDSAVSPETAVVLLYQRRRAGQYFDSEGLSIKKSRTVKKVINYLKTTNIKKV